MREPYSWAKPPSWLPAWAHIGWNAGMIALLFPLLAWKIWRRNFRAEMDNLERTE